MFPCSLSAWRWATSRSVNACCARARGSTAINSEQEWDWECDEMTQLGKAYNELCKNGKIYIDDTPARNMMQIAASAPPDQAAAAKSACSWSTISSWSTPTIRATAARNRSPRSAGG